MTISPVSVYFVEFTIGTSTEVNDVVATVKLPLDIESPELGEKFRKYVVDTVAHPYEQRALSLRLNKVIQNCLTDTALANCVVRDATIATHFNGPSLVKLGPANSPVQAYLTPYLRNGLPSHVLTSYEVLNAFFVELETPLAVFQEAIRRAGDYSYVERQAHLAGRPTGAMTDYALHAANYKRAATSAYQGLALRDRPSHLLKLVNGLYVAGVRRIDEAEKVAVAVETYRYQANIVSEQPLLGPRMVQDKVLQSLRDSVRGDVDAAFRQPSAHAAKRENVTAVMNRIDSGLAPVPTSPPAHERNLPL